jgi:hypothetical protein
MTQNPKDERESLYRLAQAMADDLLNASEEELIAEIIEDGRNPTEEAEAMRALIEKAARQNGKARLWAAKDAVATLHSGRRPAATNLGVVEARRKLASLLASEAARGLSMAARKETDMSDSDIFGMLADFEELGVLPGPKGSNS